MKFEKFVKSLASSGVISEDSSGNRWLSSPSVCMLIPPTVRSVTASEVVTMPKKIESMTDAISNTVPADLYKAIMPYADGGIKDCVRVFANATHDILIPIANPDYALIEKGDMTEILYRYNEQHDPVAVALLVKKFDFDPDDAELVGLIFPVGQE